MLTSADGMKYASVHQHGTRKNWYITYWCPRRQRRVQEPTPFLISDPQGRRKAHDLASELSKEASTDKGVGRSERWENWVPEFIRERYGATDRAKTYARYEYAWSQWRTFLMDMRIAVPRGLSYPDVIEYVRWRSSQIKPSSGKTVSKNTALCDVRCMSCIMREALHRGFADTNPCEKLGILKDPAKEKREMTDDEIATIRKELQTRPEWMQISFEIGIHQGCRLSETSIPIECIDIKRGLVTFSAKGKGQGRRVFTTVLHPGLVPLFQKLIERKLTVTCILPQMAAKMWHTFFKEIGMSHLCFHCTRVTVITRMARAGVPITEAMRFVNHSSEAVHRIYTKLGVGDLSRAVAALSSVASPVQNQGAA